MIDWANLAANALWLVGCAIFLAGLSYASWKAALRGEKLVERLKRPAYRFVFGLGGLAFSLGIAATAERTWQVVIWLLLAVYCLVQMALASRRRAA